MQNLHNKTSLLSESRRGWLGHGLRSYDRNAGVETKLCPALPFR